MKRISWRHRWGVSATIGALALVAAGEAGAQMPGVPVLQNSFANPGLTIAVNYGHSDDAQAYAGALAWAPAGSCRQPHSGALHGRAPGR